MKVVALFLSLGILVFAFAYVGQSKRLAASFAREQFLSAELAKSKHETAEFSNAYVAVLAAKVDCDRLVETLSRPSYASIH